MSRKVALPGFLAGCLGLVAGIIAAVFDVPIFAGVAGILALAAGVFGLGLAQRLAEQAAVQRLVEDELRAVRAEAQENEEQFRSEIDAATLDDYGQANAADPADTLTDPSTGLFSESFYGVALESRIAAARRHLRPVAIVLLEVIEDLSNGSGNDADAQLVAESIRVTLRDADTACRLRSGQFALLLEDTPENGAIWTVERIRRQLLTTQEGLTMWAGVACYPAHAFSSDEIMKAAEAALASAREWRQDRIEVATVAAD